MKALRLACGLFMLAAWWMAVPIQAQTPKRQARAVLTAPDAASAPAGLVKSMQDPRPLRGLNREAIPTYSSIEAFLAAHPSSNLRAAARVVGQGGGTWRAVVPRNAGGQRQAMPSGLTPSELRIDRAPNGTIRWMEGDLGRLDVPAGAAGKQTATAQAARSVAGAYAGLLRLDDPAAELRLVRVVEDDLGTTHARFEQVYAGLPVWGRDLIVHADADGAVYALNGTYEPTPRGVATTPTLNAGAARRVVVDDLRARGRWAPLPAGVVAWLGLDDPAPVLVLYPDPDLGVRPAYDVTLHPNLLERYTYLIDARTGAVLTRIARHCTLHPTAPPPAPMRVTGPPAPERPPSFTGGSFFDANATDLNGEAQTLRVYQHDDNVFYQVWDLPNFNAGASQLPGNPVGGALTIDSNSTDFDENANLTHVTSANNTWNDPVSVSAHSNMEVAFTYYQGTHGRNAIDGNGQSIISIIHVTDGGQPMDNAFWNGRVMAYGDGEQAFMPLAGGLDVAGHEMTHGVIDNSAALVYQFQSGALNESFADVFGVMIDRDDLLLGEDITRQAQALRDLLNPGNPQVLSQQPAHLSEFVNLNANQDNGGVHVNSGIPNRAAALIIQNIGHAKAEQIYYRALTTYLTRNSQFGDARTALEQAASDLFGNGSAEVAAVQQGFDAVGIVGTSGTGGEEGNDMPPQTGGQSLVAFMTEDGRIGLLNVTDFENVQYLIFGDPNARARVNADLGDRSQLTATRDGEEIWFINQQGQLAFVELEDGMVSVFTDLSIQEPGDLWNASISPDGSFAALVSAYDNDPTLYIYNGQQLGQIPLEPETTQEDIQNQTIRYPDVVSWSPNAQVPRIAFDALNEVSLLGDPLTYWSIFEIDFAAQTILNLFPAQPNDINIGNVAYSSTDPDRIAFNVVDGEGTFDVFLADFESGMVEALGISGYTIDNQPITDARRPTFSPDDGQLAFASSSFGAMLFYTRSTGGLIFFDLAGIPDIGMPVYNPNWFVQGGSGGASNQEPSASFSASTASGTAPLLVDFDASGSSDPDGGSLTYRWDFGDGSTGGGVTTSHTFAATGTFTVTLTVTDAGGASATATRQIEVSRPQGSEVVTLRNFDPSGDPRLWFAETTSPVDSGFVFGTNNFEDQAKATALTLPAGNDEGLVQEVRVWFAFKADGLTTQTYDLELYGGTAASGPSGAPIFSQTFSLADVNADADLNSDPSEVPMVYTFDEPVEVGSSFFVAINFGTYGEADWINAAITAGDLQGQRVEEVWELWSEALDGAWHNVSDAWFEDGNDGWQLWMEADVEVETVTSVEPGGEVPRSVALAPNYPNPFNPSTMLRFDLPATMDVRLDVIDLLGRTVATLVDGPMQAGVHTARFDARALPSGLYVARLRAGTTMQTQTMVLLR